MIQDPPEDDGQLYTLGLIEQLRTPMQRALGRHRGYITAWSGLLRELSNPNLHEIFPVSAFRIELWDRYGDHIH